MDRNFSGEACPTNIVLLLRSISCIPRPIPAIVSPVPFEGPVSPYAVSLHVNNVEGKSSLLTGRSQ